MTPKLSNVFDDKILESKKRVSCIGGIFQLFDCQQLLGQGHRRDDSGHAPVCPSNRRPYFSSPCSLEKSQIRRSQENQRDSMESSRTSLSSSFTTFSSIEHKSPQEEQIHTHRSFSSRSPKNSPRYPAFKDMVKESIYKDFPSALMINEDDNKINKVMKPMHSPRHTDPCKFNDLDESLTILFKLKESPRFSYDGTDISQTLVDMKQANKELSRLSLDSKEDSLRCNSSPKFNSSLKKLDNKDNRRASAALNKIKNMEINQEKPSIVAKLMGLEPLDDSKHEEPLQSPRNTAIVTRQFVSLMEKKLKKVQYQFSSNEFHDLKSAMIETKNCNTRLSSVNSESAQLTPRKHKSNKALISEGSFKSPIVILKPARKFDVSFSEAAKLGGQTGLANVRTGSSNRKKDVFNAHINTTSPRLQQIKSDLKKKASASIPPRDSNKSLRHVNTQTSDPVSPRYKLRQKPRKLQDIGFQNSAEQVNVEVYRSYRSFEHKSLFKQCIQASSIKVDTQDLIPEYKLRDLSTRELKVILSPQWSSPNSVLDALLKQDGFSNSTVSVSNAFKEYQNLLSDRSFNNGCLPQTHPSSSRSRNNLQKQVGIDNIFHDATVLGTTNEELHVTDSYATEIFQISGILQNQSDLLSMLDQINSSSPYNFVEKSNPKKLHQKFFSDVVNEIIERKISAFSSYDYKIKSHEICKEGEDENTLIHKTMLRKSQVWYSFKSEVPVIVLEMERLIFKDLINEVVDEEISVILKTKQKQPKKQQFARNGI